MNLSPVGMEQLTSSSVSNALPVSGYRFELEQLGEGREGGRNGRYIFWKNRNKTPYSQTAFN